MSYRKRKKTEEVLDYAIYVILFPFEKKFFVGLSRAASLKKSYQRHYYGERDKTKELFEKAKTENFLPPMYLLQELKTTKYESSRYLIAWEKYFLEQGYDSVSMDGAKEFTDELRDETKQIFLLIKEISFNDICKEGSDLFPDYGNKKKKKENKDSVRIGIDLKPEEYEMVKQKAEKHNMTPTAYARTMTLNEKIVDLDVFKLLNEFIKCFYERNLILKEILTAFYASEKYYPMDLKTIQDAVNETNEQKIQAIKEVQDILKSL